MGAYWEHLDKYEEEDWRNWSAERADAAQENKAGKEKRPAGAQARKLDGPGGRAYKPAWQASWTALSGAPDGGHGTWHHAGGNRDDGRYERCGAVSGSPRANPPKSDSDSSYRGGRAYGFPLAYRVMADIKINFFVHPTDRVVPEQTEFAYNKARKVERNYFAPEAKWDQSRKDEAVYQVALLP